MRWIVKVNSFVVLFVDQCDLSVGKVNLTGQHNNNNNGSQIDGICRARTCSSLLNSDSLTDWLADWQDERKLYSSHARLKRQQQNRKKKTFFPFLFCCCCCCLFCRVLFVVVEFARAEWHLRRMLFNRFVSVSLSLSSSSFSIHREFPSFKFSSLSGTGTKLQMLFFCFHLCHEQFNCSIIAWRQVELRAKQSKAKSSPKTLNFACHHHNHHHHRRNLKFSSLHSASHWWPHHTDAQKRLPSTCWVCLCARVELSWVGRTDLITSNEGENLPSELAIAIAIAIAVDVVVVLGKSRQSNSHWQLLLVLRANNKQILCCRCCCCVCQLTNEQRKNKFFFSCTFYLFAHYFCWPPPPLSVIIDFRAAAAATDDDKLIYHLNSPFQLQPKISLTNKYKNLFNRPTKQPKPNTTH